MRVFYFFNTVSVAIGAGFQLPFFSLSKSQLQFLSNPANRVKDGQSGESRNIGGKYRDRVLCGDVSK